MSRKVFPILFVQIGMALLAACNAQPISPTPQTNLPNPASVYCEENGGRLEMRQDASGGVQGICIFTDGSECDEWAYYRGECSPAETDTNAPTAFPTPLPIDAADYEGWWNYTHTVYGFSIMFPEDWIVEAIAADDPLLGGHLLNLHPQTATGKENIRVTFPYRLVTLDGMDWAYIATEGYGEGEVVLVLAGALCAPEVSWKTIAALAGKYRVIAPEYPPLDRMEALVDGIAAVLKREGVTQAHVLGGSYGGFVAQVFVRSYPELTRSLVLSHTLPPYAESAKSARKIMPWLALLPGSVLRWLMGKRLSGLLPEQTPETAALYAVY